MKHISFPESIKQSIKKSIKPTDFPCFSPKNASRRGPSAVRLLGTPSIGLQGELRDTWFMGSKRGKKHGKTMMIVDECE